MIRDLVGALVVLSEFVMLVTILCYADRHGMPEELCMVFGAILGAVIGWTVPDQFKALS